MIDIMHVYYSSPGMAGLYLHEISRCLTQSNYSQVLITNYYYPFPNAHRLFFRRTERYAGRQGRGKVRLIERYVELCLGLAKVIILARRQRPKVINYSLTNSFAIEEYALRLIKSLVPCKLVITCHDVVPFSNEHMSVDREVLRRKSILGLGDYILVHTRESERELVRTFAVDSERVVWHSFPIMDPRELRLTISESQDVRWDFCFVGFLRKEKGIDLLLDAWTVFNSLHPDARLAICGDIPANNLGVRARLSTSGIEYLGGYVDDITFAQVLSGSRYVVLPYLSGTNSGIPSSARCLGTDVIASDLPMFRESALISSENLFQAGSVDSLLVQMEMAYCSSASYQSASNDPVVAGYRTEFERSVRAVYMAILSNQV